MLNDKKGELDNQWDTDPNIYCDTCGESGATPETVGWSEFGEYLDPINVNTCSDDCTQLIRDYYRGRN